MIIERNKSMKKITLLRNVGIACVFILGAAGCATEKNGQHFPTKYHTTDNRIAEVGRRTKTDDGWTFREPHMDKCWIAADFNFTGYDTLYIAPTLSTAVAKDDEDRRMIEIAKDTVVVEFKRLFQLRGLFTNVVTKESDIPAGAHALKLEQTIIDFNKGSMGARIWAGEFGAGQPVLSVAGKMTAGDQPVFTYEARRSGVSVGAHLGVMMGGDIQVEDVRSMALDVADFAAAMAGKYRPAN